MEPTTKEIIAHATIKAAQPAMTMTKFESFAQSSLQAMLAGGNMPASNEARWRVATDAIEMATAMIAALARHEIDTRVVVPVEGVGS